MKFYAVCLPEKEERSTEGASGAAAGKELSAALAREYKAAREIGVVRIGEERLFFRVRLRIYWIPYTDIRRCFRRVMMVPAAVCCGRGELPVENLVVTGERGELAQIQLPGTRAAKELMKALQEKMPDIPFSKPE